MQPRAGSRGSAISTRSPGGEMRRWQGWSGRLQSSRETSPTRIWRCSRHVFSRMYWFSGDLERAGERAEFALDIAETHAFREALTIALRAKAAVVFSKGHMQEADALLRHALQIAIDDDLADHAGTCYFLLSDGCFRGDRYAEALAYLDEGVVLARKVGHRPFEWALARRADVRAVHARELGRGAGRGRRVHGRAAPSRRCDAEPAADGRRDPRPTR